MTLSQVPIRKFRTRDPHLTALPLQHLITAAGLADGQQPAIGGAGEAGSGDRDVADRSPKARADRAAKTEQEPSAREWRDGLTIELFDESFEHLVDFAWMIADGFPHRSSLREAFRDYYVRGYEPRARVPHHVTVHRTVETVVKLQRAGQLARVKRIIAEFKGRGCFGIQLDMWTNAPRRPHATLPSTSHTLTSRRSSTCSLRCRPSCGSSASSSPLASSRSRRIRPPTSRCGCVASSVTQACRTRPSHGHHAGRRRRWPSTALNDTETLLREKVDTCHLHYLQRSRAQLGGLGQCDLKEPRKQGPPAHKHQHVCTLTVQSDRCERSGSFDHACGAVVSAEDRLGCCGWLLCRCGVATCPNVSRN